MAREAKKDPSELTVEEKLKALYQLQTMLSEIDKIKTLRGELPLEVQDLEDEVAGLSTRIEKIKADIEELKSNIATKKIEIDSFMRFSQSSISNDWNSISFVNTSYSRLLRTLSRETHKGIYCSRKSKERGDRAQ